MRIEALNFKKEDKTEVSIYVMLTDIYSSKTAWRIEDIQYRNYKKRAWNSLKQDITDSIEYRHMAYDDKNDYLKKKFEEFVGRDKIKEAYLSAWESIKPDFNILISKE